jgi:oligoendopeptidase F
MTPEILSHERDELQTWMDDPVLQADRYAMIRLIRRQAHTLSETEETLLSKAGELFGASARTFELLTNADLKFPDIKDRQGNRHPLSEGRYVKFLMDYDRDLRREAFNTLYDTYATLKNTLSCTLSHAVKNHNYKASVRHFDSALQCALQPDHVPVELYSRLIEVTHNALPYFHEYIRLRGRALQLDDPDMFDMYVPLVSDYSLQVPFRQACDWVVEACRPLGRAYTALLERAFTERWIDVYENRGKRSGAYSSGCYDSPPYVLLNYNGTLNDVFTLAHELGHSLHSWLAREAQAYRYAAYPIFIAEIASTLNEELLLRYLLKHTEEDAFRAYLLNHRCDSFKGTVYRQVMFAEFEWIIHQQDAEGIPLTAQTLSDQYAVLNARYHGLDMQQDSRIALEWARIPHFYYHFYVYKYATSFCASQVFADRVLSGTASREQYLDLLRAGGSDDPLTLIQHAGVDLLDPQTLTHAFDRFVSTVRQLADLL